MSGLHPRDVSAVLVTRGDVDIQPMLDTMRIYGEVHVWNNAETVFNARTFGRWLAAQRSANKVWYFQDDDIIFDRHLELCAEHRAGLATLNMPSPWYEQVQKSWWDTKLPLGMFGGGALVPRYLARPAFAPYLERWGPDDLFFELCDLVAGTFIPWKRVDLGFEELPTSVAPNRICKDPERHSKRAEMRKRVAILARARARS